MQQRDGDENENTAKISKQKLIPLRASRENNAIIYYGA